MATTKHAVHVIVSSLADKLKIDHDHLVAEIVGAVKDSYMTVGEGKAMLCRAGLPTVDWQGIAIELAGKPEPITECGPLFTEAQLRNAAPLCPGMKGVLG